MKRRYERPSAYIEEFTPNEYVAACGDSGTIYKFRYNAGKKWKHYNVYYMNGNKKTYIANNQWGSGAQFDSYHPCDKTHEAESDSGFIRGFIDDQSTWKDEKIPVYIWTDRGTDVHCTTDLDKSTWETAKS